MGSTLYRCGDHEDPTYVEPQNDMGCSEMSSSDWLCCFLFPNIITFRLFSDGESCRREIGFNKSVRQQIVKPSELRLGQSPYHDILDRNILHLYDLAVHNALHVNFTNQLVPVIVRP